MIGDSHHWTAGQIVLDHFVVERELGAGGMGKVYLVRVRSTGEVFAVKAARFRNPVHRQSFLAELRTWIDLPEHPHLVACRFLRTVGEDLVVFAEYVAGGALATWIAERRLTQLDRMLDVAIQFAWGLHALHDLGLVHQDVKPGNALLTTEGIVKVADFGLSRARAPSEPPASRNGALAPMTDTDGGPRWRTLVSSGGLTPAYCSPEQSRGERLSRQTDVWSWGVSVLELFVGEVTWSSGLVAEEVLNRLLRTGPADPRLPRMPETAAAVLRKCFRQKPAERWATLAEAAVALCRTYRDAVGETYTRVVPPPIATGPRMTPLRAEHAAFSTVSWNPPRKWLELAYEADGRDLALADKFLVARAGSTKAQRIAELAAYEEAQQILDRLVREGRHDLDGRLAQLCLEKAALHQDADDLAGAAAQHDRALAILERLVEHEGRIEAVHPLAVAFLNKAVVMHREEKRSESQALLDRAIALAEWAMKKNASSDFLTSALGRLLANKALLLRDVDPAASAALIDRAIAFLQPLVERDQRFDLAGDLCFAWSNKANALSQRGEHREAMKLYARPIALCERLVDDQGRLSLTNDLAGAYLDKARAILGVFTDMKRMTGRETAPLSEVHDCGWVTISGIIELGQEAFACCDRAIARLEWLVEHQGREDLVERLAWACLTKGHVMAHCARDYVADAALCARAIALCRFLVHKKGRLEMAGSMAAALSFRATSLLQIGARTEALADANEAVRILKAEIEVNGRTNLEGLLREAMDAVRQAT